MKRMVPAALLLAALLGPAAAGAAGVPLDAIAAVRYALANAPEILAKKATIAELVSTFARDRAAEFPSITGNLQNTIQKQANLNGNLAQFGITPTTNFSQNTAQITSTYNLYNGTAQLTAEQARKQVDSAAADLRRQEEQTAVDVASAFYNLVARRRDVAVDENDVKYQETLLQAAQAQERVGRVAGVDVLRARVAVARSRSNLVQAKVDDQNAGEALAVRIGATADTAFALPENVPEPALPLDAPDVLAKAALQARPEIGAARATLDAAKLGDASVDEDLRPTVQVQGSFGSQVSGTEDVAEQQQIDQANAQSLAQYNLYRQFFPGVKIPPPVILAPIDRNKPGFWQLNVVSSFSVPAYDYGQRSAAHRAARAQIDSARASFENVRQSVEADVRAATRNAAAALEKLHLARESADLARESARITQLQYKSGLVSLTDTLQTEQVALSAESDLTAAQVAYAVALIRLRTSLGPPDAAAAADLRGL
jgi:outer membrane protein TolC